MEAKWKIWLGLIGSIVIVFLTEKYYFNMGFFEQTIIGFLHDLIVFIISLVIWAMFGLLGFYRSVK